MDDNMCEYCGGPISLQQVTVQYSYQGHLVLIENVPAGVCHHCGERYYDAHVVKAMEQIAGAKGNVDRVLQVPVKIFESVAA